MCHNKSNARVIADPGLKQKFPEERTVKVLVPSVHVRKSFLRVEEDRCELKVDFSEFTGADQ